MRAILIRASGADDLAAKGAELVASRARAAVSERGRFRLAVSGGKTPWEMFALLRAEELAWERIEIFQVDERVAPDGDPARNLTNLRASLGSVPAVVFPMPVDDPDLEAAAGAYAAGLPERFDLVHLGLGPDGHTASLVPGDPVLSVTDRLVAVTRPYQGHRRMTLTYEGLSLANEILWIVGGADKREALSKLLEGDPSIPAGRVEADAMTVVADAEAC